MKKCKCGNKVATIRAGENSYSVSTYAWCSNCGAIWSGGMNKSTREYYGSWEYPKKIKKEN
jgi:hypothetical protein